MAAHLERGGRRRIGTRGEGTGQVHRRRIHPHKQKEIETFFFSLHEVDQLSRNPIVSMLYQMNFQSTCVTVTRRVWQCNGPSNTNCNGVYERRKALPGRFSP